MIKKDYSRPTLIKKIMLSTKASELVTVYLDSENHYFDRARILNQLKDITNFSERELASVVKVSKTEINRTLSLYKVIEHCPEFYDAAKKFGTDKWVFVMLSGLQSEEMIVEISQMILNGTLTKYSLFGEQFARVHSDAEKRTFNERPPIPSSYFLNSSPLHQNRGING